MKNKKVGLLTWHYYDNVGSNLQAYALYNTINNKGYDCRFINYRKKEFDDFFIKAIVKKICSFFNKIGIIKDTSPLAFKSKQFQSKYFKTTKKCNYKSIKKYENCFDIYICGSDQIWAPSVFDENYFLSFVNNKSKNSYAASLGLNSIPDNLKNKYKELLLGFNMISVRERQGKELLEKIGIKSTTVLDPTFLLDKNQWSSIANKNIIKNRKKYIFCYFLGKNNEQLEYVKKYSEETYKELIVYSPVNDISEFNFKNVLKRIGPEEFISYISNADHVFTDSYHGCIFSIIFEKKFHIFLRFDDKKDKNSQNSRIYNLIELFSLDSILIKDYDSINLKEIENYQSINVKLEKYKNESDIFLNSILEGKYE